MNAILDGYPNEFEGYLIRTDFRIGMQICLCLADEELDEIEKLQTALDLLFGNAHPVIAVALEGLSWYLNGGNIEEHIDKHGHDNGEDEEPGDAFNFDIDSSRINSAFMRAYNIDLTTTSMHWFRFIELLSDVGECAFSNVINIRTKKLTSEMSQEYRSSLAELKKKYTLNKYSDEEKEMLNAFYASLEGNV